MPDLRMKNQLERWIGRHRSPNNHNPNPPTRIIAIIMSMTVNNISSTSAFRPLPHEGFGLSGDKTAKPPRKGLELLEALDWYLLESCPNDSLQKVKG
jgi:hypothetical protein